MGTFGRMSELKWIEHCGGLLTIPRPPEIPNVKRDEAAAYGTLAHAWKETGVIPVGDGLLHRTLRAKVERLPEGEREKLWPEPGVHELRVSWDPVSERSVLFPQFPDWERRRWSLSGITGTLDYAGKHNGLPWIDDLKTGKTDYGPPNQFAPLLGYASAYLGALEPDSACYVSLTYFRRYPVGVSRFERVGPVFVSRARLAAFRARVVTSVTGRGLNSGDHCTYCPAFRACPEQE